MQTKLTRHEKNTQTKLGRRCQICCNIFVTFFGHTILTAHIHTSRHPDISPSPAWATHELKVSCVSGIITPFARTANLWQVNEVSTFVNEFSGQRKAFSFGLSECLAEEGGRQRVGTDPRHVYMYRFVSKTALNRKNFMRRFPRVVAVSVEYFLNLSNYYCFIYPFTIEEKGEREGRRAIFQIIKN